MNAQSIPANDEEVNGWFYVEVFGHTQLAGRVTTRKFGSSVMFQVDVPKGETEFSHSQLFSPSSIFVWRKHAVAGFGRMTNCLV